MARPKFVDGMLFATAGGVSGSVVYAAGGWLGVVGWAVGLLLVSLAIDRLTFRGTGQ